MVQASLDLASTPTTTNVRKWKKSQDGDHMAELFRMYPNQPISALRLEETYGLRWRTTVSDLRFPPYDMNIVNEQVPYVNAQGRKKRKSFYKYVPDRLGA